MSFLRLNLSRGIQRHHFFLFPTTIETTSKQDWQQGRRATQSIKHFIQMQLKQKKHG